MTAIDAGGVDYALARRVLPLDVGGEARRRVLGAIAAFLDEGAEPSLREIAERADVGDWKRAKLLIERLEADGFLAVEWVRARDWRRARRDRVRAPRNRYEVIV